MKIIKQGQLPETFSTEDHRNNYQGTCPNCGCIIEVTKAEVVFCEYAELPDKYNGICPTPNCNHTPIYVARQYFLPIVDGDNELPVCPFLPTTLTIDPSPSVSNNENELPVHMGY
jgi:hypothetical protein